MPHARIHFVRHAETLFNVRGQLQGWCDSPLTERGERQAAALGERMREVPLATAFTSDLTRTRTTASAALIGHPDVPVLEMRDLREWHFGSWEGQPNDSLWAPVFADHGYSYAPASPDWPKMTADGYDSVLDSVHRHDPSGRAEAAGDVRLRLARGLKVVVAAAEQAARTGEGDVLVVTHGAVLGGMLRHIAPAHLLPAGFPNCGIVTVAWHAGKGDVAVGEIDASCALQEMAVSAG
jgi:broad specificity phosphatase PhoE